MTVLVVGGDSTIGGALAARLAAAGRPVLATTRRAGTVGPGRTFLDLAAPADRWALPDGIVSAPICAAVARLPDCAADPAGARRVNVDGAVALARRLTDAGAHVLFLSSDKVFGGSVANVPAERPPAPASVYGQQKAEAEAAMLRLAADGAAIAILRLSKVVARGWPLLRDWAEALAAGRRVSAISDMVLAPVPLALAADAAAAIVNGRSTGIYQLSGPQDIAYPTLARRLADRLGADLRLVRETTAHEAGLPAGLAPHHTTMDSDRLAGRFGIAVPGPWQVLDPILDDIVLRLRAAPVGAAGRIGAGS